MRVSGSPYWMRLGVPHVQWLKMLWVLPRLLEVRCNHVHVTARLLNILFVSVITVASLAEARLDAVVDVLRQQIEKLERLLSAKDDIDQAAITYMLIMNKVMYNFWLLLE